MSCKIKANLKVQMFALLFLFSCLTQSAPFIIFDKKIVEESSKVNEPVHVMYRILNLGDSPAMNLHIDDNGIPLEQWDFPEPSNNLRWNTIAPGQNITHIFKVRPVISGNLRMGSSRLRYTADGQKKIALSTQIFWFESRSTHSIGAKDNLQGYLITVSISALAIFVPLFVWLIVKPSKKIKSKPN